MHIVVKVQGRLGSNLMMELAQRQISPIPVKNGMIIELPFFGDGQFEQLAALNGNGIPLLDVSEHGGKGDGSDIASIVCGMNGELLWPHTTMRNPRRCGDTARFSYNTLVMVTACDAGKQAVIRKCRPARQGTVVWVETEVIWAGSTDQLPAEHECFRAAVDAASAKSRCSGCNHVHYGKQRDRDEA
ncbi:MAG: hypothetical protein PHH01_00310 [Patescibacteria group bacterium]|nr:hypothetical protein [Patescibacteria group bacterium]